MNLLWQQKLCNLQQLKIAVFTYRSTHFCFPWRRPCDHHAICCMDGKTIYCLTNPMQHIPIYLQQFPSHTMLKSMRKSKNHYFYHIFVSPGDGPWCNDAKYCMDGKRIRCLQIVSQQVSIYSVWPLRLWRNMLHGWKDNSMLAKPLAACTYLYSIVSELYDA